MQTCVHVKVENSVGVENFPSSFKLVNYHIYIELEDLFRILEWDSQVWMGDHSEGRGQLDKGGDQCEEPASGEEWGYSERCSDVKVGGGQL